MMEKRNLKRAIAKFEELAADEDYEGNHKIINLDKFLQSDLSKKKKKKRDHLESTPIKCNTERSTSDSHLDNTFDDDESSNEVKTADEFLKRLISQPPIQLDKHPKQPKQPSKSISLLSSNQVKKVTSKQSNSTMAKSSADKSTSNKSSKSTSSANKSTNSTNLFNNSSRTLKETKFKEAERKGDQKLKEHEKQFLMKFQQNRQFDEESEEYDDEELDDEIDRESDVFDEELDEEQDEQSDAEKQSLDDESIDPDSSSMMNEQQLEDESIDAESISYGQKRLNDESFSEFPTKFTSHQYSQRHQLNASNKMYKRQSGSANSTRESQQGKALCRINDSSSSNRGHGSVDYVTNYEYQRTATEELYKLILKSDDCSYNILTRLTKNIEETLGQVDLPHPSKVRPFFHFTPDNQIHVTFLFINPNDVYSNPWQQIISVNYSNLSILFDKIYELIFNFNILIKKQ